MSSSAGKKMPSGKRRQSAISTATPLRDVGGPPTPLPPPPVPQVDAPAPKRQQQSRPFGHYVDLGEQKAIRDGQFKEAEKWCKDNEKGARACLSKNPHLCANSGQGGLLKKNALDLRLNGKVTTGAEYASNAVLTDMEEKELVEWCILCNLGRASKNMSEIGIKVREILLVRHARNRMGGRKPIPLSGPAKAIAIGKSFPSQSFFARFFGLHSKVLENKTAQPVEAARAAAANDATVEEHFEGVWGFRNELIDAGIMDSDTHEITDPRRVLNRDECPQFIDYNDNKGNAKGKSAGGKGDSVFTTSAVNRTCVTVDMTIGLDGFQYGVHFILARKTLDDELITERLGDYFTSKIYEEKFMMCSTHCLVSTTEKGVQTAVTLLECMKLLDEELTLRKVPRPVVICSDNHASRKDEVLLQWCADHGIRLFFELANTSGFLQALDQFNKKYHEAYKKEKKRYKAALRDEGVSDPQLDLADFLQINAEIWNTWWSPSDRRTSFRRVGILQNRIDATKVNREKFHFPLPPPVAKKEVLLVAASPEGLAKGGQAYYKAKFECQLEITKDVYETEVGPKEAGILVPEVVQRKRSAGCKRITDGHGSATLSKLLELRKTNRMAAEAEVMRKGNAAQERADRKAASNDAAMAELELWRACLGVCVCAPPEGGPCPMASLVLCPYCDTLKKRACGVRSCKEAAAMEAGEAADTGAAEGGDEALAAEMDMAEI